MRGRAGARGAAGGSRRGGARRGWQGDALRSPPARLESPLSSVCVCVCAHTRTLHAHVSATGAQSHPQRRRARGRPGVTRGCRACLWARAINSSGFTWHRARISAAGPGRAPPSVRPSRCAHACVPRAVSGRVRAAGVRRGPSRGLAVRLPLLFSKELPRILCEHLGSFVLGVRRDRRGLVVSRDVFPQSGQRSRPAALDLSGFTAASGPRRCHPQPRRGV